MKRLWLFLIACVLPGLGGAVGSILGNAFGKRGLWVGGIVGGLVVSVFVAWLAVKLRWITPEQRVGTALGTAVGFLIAVAIAVNTLSSPVGPILSTALSGFGALVGSRWGRETLPTS